MLTRFAVSGYRNFSHEFSLDLEHPRDYQFNRNALAGGIVKCALVYGKNAVGKTNLGYAMLDARDARRAWRSINDEDPCILNADAPCDRARFEYGLRFGRENVRLTYEKDAQGHLVWEEMDLDGELLYRYDYVRHRTSTGDRAPAPFSTLNFDEVDGSLSILQYVCNNSPSGSLGILSQTYDFIRRMRIVQGNMPSHLPSQLATRRVVERGEVGKLEGFLHRFGIEEKLVVRQNPSGDEVVYFDKKRLVPFYRNCSSGTRSLLSLYNALEIQQPPSLLFIDEFDACYHHELAEELLAYLKEQPSTQVICTTHNTDLFSNRLMRPDCLFILSGAGLVSAADATDRELREGHNLQKLFKAGEFDG